MMRAWPPSVPVVLVVSLCSLTAVDAAAQTFTTPGPLSASSTIHSIGLEWDIANDADHDASAQVTYRAASSAVWKTGLPLVRVHDGSRNMLAGSLFFLEPGTEYVVRVTLHDPDGGSDARNVTVWTRPLPGAPTWGRVFHVLPGGGGGDGSPGSPFRGVAAAEAVAQPGDTFLLHGGDYGGRIAFRAPGAASAHVVWKAFGDGEVTMAGIDIAASHVWLEGLTVRGQYYGTRTENAPADVVLIRSFLYDNFYSIFLSDGGSGWYIADNTIVGATDPASGSFEGEGIDLQITGGHTVAHNSITRVADGISYPLANVDIFGNDIFDTSDDGIELDYGMANVRVWGNRIHNPYHNGISFQPQLGGPWYIIRNQIVGGVEAPLKFRTVDRFVLLHNTMVGWDGYMFCCQANDLQKAFARNNLWISVQGAQMWAGQSSARDWRTDLDYDGFDWGAGLYPFFFDGVIYYDIPSFAQASGHQAHGIRVHRGDCFADLRMDGPSPTPVPPHLTTLNPWCNAVDAGQVLPNVNDGFAGGAPDIGAHEYGAAPALYGPRLEDAPPAITVTSPAPGSTFTAPATLTLAASAADAGAVTRVDFHAGTAFLGQDTTAPFSMVWSNVPAGSYSLTATAVDDAGNVTTSGAVSVQVHEPSLPPPPPAGLPAGWSHGDVGDVGVTGSGAGSGASFTVQASGADVWDSSDAFGFIHRTLTGDGTIVARVSSLSNTHDWAKAGVMMRDSLSPGSPHAFVLVTPEGSNGVAFQYRASSGGATAHVSGGAGAAPVWVRLTRSGQAISAARSWDGVSWTTIGTASVAMGAAIDIGLAVTSHDNGALAAATFDSVEVASIAAPSTALTAPWAAQDVGSVGIAGQTSVSGGTWVVQGSGADVWGTADGFHYAFRSLSGDGSIVARVSAVRPGDPWAKAGLMMRARLTAGSAHAFVFATPDGGHGLAFQRRTVAGGATTHTSGGAGAAPVWLKLTRTGQTVVAFRSPDGVSWTEIGRDTIAMAAAIHVGLAVTSHDNAALGSATFEDVEVSEGVEVSGGAGAGWSAHDVGSVGATGVSVPGDSGWTVSGSGADIWDTSDAFQYAYTPVAGDFTVTARVASLTAVDPWTKAGLMIRASTGAGSVHASLFATSAHGLAFQRRTEPDALSAHTWGPALTPAVWIRLSRQGGTISAAYRDPDGSWITFTSEWIGTLPESVLVGLAVTSHQDGSLATAVFDSVAVE